MRELFSLLAEWRMKFGTKKILIAAFVIFLSDILRAQQTTLLSHYYYNPYLINPAMAGQSKETRAFLFYRQQWVGMPGAPQTQALTVGRV